MQGPRLLQFRGGGGGGEGRAKQGLGSTRKTKKVRDTTWWPSRRREKRIKDRLDQEQENPSRGETDGLPKKEEKSCERSGWRRDEVGARAVWPSLGGIRQRPGEESTGIVFWAD